MWQGRYKSFIVENDRCLLTVIRYIEGNPVRICLAQSADEWRWSSHCERLDSADEKLIDESSLALPEKWTEYVNTPLTGGELERMQQCVNRGAPFGSYPWQTMVCEKLGLESTIRPKGRPRKWGQEK